MFQRMGLSIVISTQNWTGQAAGIPRSLRANTTCIALYGLRDVSMLEKVLDEFGGDIDPITFEAMYKYATAGEKWNFMFCEPGVNRWRKNFDEILNPADFAKKITDGKSDGPNNEEAVEGRAAS